MFPSPKLQWYDIAFVELFTKVTLRKFVEYPKFAVGKSLTVTVNEFDVAGLFVTQDSEEVKIHVIISPSFNVEEEYVLPVPTLEPFTCH